jgi:4-hydroxybenzoate polyprenyltransferase
MKSLSIESSSKPADMADPAALDAEGLGRGGGRPGTWLYAVWPYVQIARPDHWFKNAFMLLGVILAAFYMPDQIGADNLVALGLAFAAVCLVASSNYAINELLDGATDARHPTKRFRPVPAGRVRAPLVYVEWLALAAVGIGIGRLANVPVALAAAALWVMGIVYNVRPLRLKEWPYVDVLCESINNPLRLLLGWFVIVPRHVPPVSLILAYWMLGAFFMATKRFAEYRRLADPALAADYRASFRHYTDDRLLVSLMVYATISTLFAGIFIVRYHLELILFTPFIGGLFGYYLHIGLRPDSPVQNPERLHRERGFMLYLALSVALFVLLMYVRIPVLYEWFHVEPHGTDPLWVIDGQ